MSVNLWLQLLKTNVTIKLPSEFVFNYNILQEVISKYAILKIVVDLSRNSVGLY